MTVKNMADLGQNRYFSPAIIIPSKVGNVDLSPANDPQNLYKEVLHGLDKYTSNYVLFAGDFNIHLIKHERENFSQNFLDTAAEYGLIKVLSIFFPTCITDRSATLISHVDSNIISKVIVSSFITIYITIQYPPYNCCNNFHRI